MQTTAEKKQGSRRAAGHLIPGTALAIAATVSLIYLGAILMLNGKLPEDASGLIVTASVFCGAAAGGALSARRKGRGGEAGAGLACGALFALLLAAASLVLPNGEGLTAQLARYALASAAGGFFGGMLCVKRVGIKKRRRRRK